MRELNLLLVWKYKDYMLHLKSKFANDVSTEMMGLYSILASICAMLDAWCFAPCYVTHNARGAIVLGSLTSKLADSLCVDYLVQVTPRKL